jgi:hypothetical protein
MPLILVSAEILGAWLFLFCLAAYVVGLLYLNSKVKLGSPQPRASPSQGAIKLYTGVFSIVLTLLLLTAIMLGAICFFSRCE